MPVVFYVIKPNTADFTHRPVAIRNSILVGEQHTEATPDNILAGEQRQDENPSVLLDRFCSSLSALPEGSKSNDMLKALPLRLSGTCYDVPNPYGDHRAVMYSSVWCFDFPKDTLVFMDSDVRRRMPLSRLREGNVTMSDFEAGEPVMPIFPTLSVQALGTWRPEVKVEPRTRALTHRLLRDFDWQWRHLFRGQYNQHTRLRLARAVLQLATLDIDVHELTGWQRSDLPRGPHVWTTQLPIWPPLAMDSVLFGDVHIMVDDDVERGLQVAKTLPNRRKTCRVPNGLPHAVVLSLKHIVLCRVAEGDRFEHTEPLPLFNGGYEIGPASDLALDYLVWATTGAREKINTSLDLLPTELQDMVLRYASSGTACAAILGCKLGLGTPFDWTDGRRKLELVYAPKHRTSYSPVESRILFGSYGSGLNYKGR